MKFYDCATAPSPRRVRVFLAEKGVSLPIVQVDLKSGQQLTESFRKINPACTVPVLTLDDGTVITEAIAICRYLEDIYPDPPLLGVDARDRALVSMWDHRAEVEGFLAVSEAFRNEARGLRERAVTGVEKTAQIPELATRGRMRIARFFDVLDSRLGESAFLAGPHFTMADITSSISVAFASWVKMEVPDDHANLRRWYNAVKERPSFEA
jgi:glutathione S-transferase